MADSPFSVYTGAVLIHGIWCVLLFITLLAGGLLFVNLGLMSKRAEDRIGGRTPSDLGVLQENVWPEAAYYERALPAEDEEYEAELQALQAIEEDKDRAA